VYYTNRPYSKLTTIRQPVDKAIVFHFVVFWRAVMEYINVLTKLEDPEI